MKLRLFNIRIPAFVALELVVAVLAGFFFYLGDTILFSVALLVNAFGAVICVVLFRFNKYTVCFMLGIVLMIVSTVHINAIISNRHSFEGGEDVEVVGVTSDTISVSEGEATFWLERLEFDGERVEGKLVLTVASDISLKAYTAGMQFRFKANISKILLVRNRTVNTNALANNLRYNARVKVADIIITEGRATVFSAIRQRIKSTLQNNLSEDMAALSFAMLVGDTVNLSSEISHSFRVSGVTHIVSVSGLHVGFYVLAIHFVMDKLLRLRHKRKLKLVIASVLLFAYCLLCGFTPTVVRASIMSIVMLISVTLFLRYDILNSISMSAIILLLINPLMIFDVGFQLSFLAVIGIAGHAFWLDIALKKLIKLKWLRVSIVITTAAQLATVPQIMYYFHTYSAYSLLSNLLIVQLTEIGFIAQMIVVPAAMVVPQLGFSVNITGYPYQLAVWVSNLIASIPNAIILVMAFSPLYFIGLHLLVLLSSRYVVMGKRARLISTSVLLFMLFLGVIYRFFPVPQQKVSATMSDIGYSKDIIITTNNETVLISNLASVSSTVQLFSSSGVNKVDYLYLTANTEPSKLKEYCTILRVKKVLVPVASNMDVSLYSLDIVESVGHVDEREIGGLNFTFYVYDNVYYGTLVEGERRLFVPVSEAQYVLSFFELYFPRVLEGEYLYGGRVDGYDYSYYFYNTYGDLVTNYSGNRVNDCYIMAL